MRRLVIAATMIGLWVVAAGCTSPVTNATDISTGSKASCLINSDGGVECWGQFSQVFMGAFVVGYGNTATAIPEIPSGATDIEVGGEHVCAIVSGTVKCWGDNSIGQTGTGPNGNPTTPTDVVGLPANDPAVQLSTYWHTTCVRLQSGAAACWGWNADGQLGDGGTSLSTTAVMVTGLNGTAGNKITDITVGGEFACATRPNGTVGCWGSDLNGQLGNGTGQADSLVPAPVPGLTDVVAIEAGNEHVCAATDTNDIHCWGDNGSDQLGAGAGAGAGSIVEVPTPYSLFGSPVVSFAGGFGRSCAVLGDGRAQCVGANGSGALGNGTTTNSSTPTVVVGTGGAQAVAKFDTHGGHSCLVGVNGQVACWGIGFYGQLGNAGNGDSSIPVQVVR